MRKVYVTELSQQSRDLFEKLAKAHGFTQKNIEEDLSGEISDMFEAEQLLGFRSCNNNECREFFTEGYLIEDPSETFCSRKCAEKIYIDIVEEDYGTDIIFWTEWETEA